MECLPLIFLSGKGTDLLKFILPDIMKRWHLLWKEGSAKDRSEEPIIYGKYKKYTQVKLWWKWLVTLDIKWS